MRRLTLRIMMWRIKKVMMMMVVMMLVPELVMLAVLAAVSE